MPEIKLVDNNGAEEIAVVGAGISGVVTAYALHRKKYAVSLYDRGTDPRSNTDEESASSTHSGATIGVGRFITTFEGHPYLDREEGGSLMYPNMRGAFKQSVSQGGWLGKGRSQYSEEEKKWLRKRDRSNYKKKKIGDGFDEYVRQNTHGMHLWRDMMRRHPQLFEGANLFEDNVLRLYDSKDLLKWAREAHEKEGICLKTLTPSEVVHEYPALEHGYRNKHIAGGLEVPGMTFNVRRVVQNILSFLEKKDVSLHWNTDVTGIQQTTAGHVRGLMSSEGLIKADHFSLHPGAYGADILKGTPAEGLLSGVAGRWLITPRPKGMNRPIKIHGDARKDARGRKYPVVDLNLTPLTGSTGKKLWAVGGGYVYVGNDASKLDRFRRAFDVIDSENVRTMGLLFGEQFRNALANGEAEIVNATCVRSFTPNDRPVDVTMPTARGGILTIDGGTNTGTTTLAPSIADAVVRKVRGKRRLT